MIRGRSILAIIPARGGSKGLPKKNIRLMCGKPLISWTIEQANVSRYLDTVFVSTDSEEIATIAKQYGAVIPFMRPAEMARDDSPTADAVVHAIQQFSQAGRQFDYIVLLEPTSPLRKPTDIDNAIELIINTPDADCLVSLGEVHMEHPLIVKRIQEDGFLTPYMSDTRKIHQRQQADQAYFPYGVVYISTVPAFLKNRTFYSERTIPYLIDRWQNYEIDDEIDFLIVEQLANLKLKEIYG
jgi:CMP-N,N'-diacetyllegionaminic acid synthase